MAKVVGIQPSPALVEALCTGLTFRWLDLSEVLDSFFTGLQSTMFERGVDSGQGLELQADAGTVPVAEIDRRFSEWLALANSVAPAPYAYLNCAMQS